MSFQTLRMKIYAHIMLLAKDPCNPIIDYFNLRPLAAINYSYIN